jgi:hypothetical protein
MNPVEPYASDDAAADWRRSPPSGADLPRLLGSYPYRTKVLIEIKPKNDAEHCSMGKPVLELPTSPTDIGSSIVTGGTSGVEQAC